MKRPNYVVVFILLFASFLWIESAQAAQTTQTITLKAGWNAVFLEVQPQDTEPDNVFAPIKDQLTSVWRWNPNSSTVEFIQDPDTLVPEGPQWLVYLPNDPILTNLHAIHGETAYLINMAAAATLLISGEPKVPEIEWKPNSFNFVGFHLTSGLEPLFGDFFSSSLAHTDQEIYILENDNWVRVTEPQTTLMKQGEGLWIYCKGSSQFTGPLSIQLEQGGGLHYGSMLAVQDVVFKNNSLSDRTVTLSLSNGTVPLYYWNFDPASNVAEWAQFPPPNLNIPGGESRNLRLGVKRSAGNPPLQAGQKYTANLDLTDGAGTYIQIPISVTGFDHAGLWVGQATINKVSRVATADEPSPLKTPTGSEFQFRLLVHVEEGSGTVRLLNQVFQMWDENQEPPSAVLFTDDALISNYSGVSLRDGRMVGRRISAPAFGTFYAENNPPFITKVNEKVMNPGGVFGQDGATITFIVGLPKDDPTNPFVHKYHPDHLVPDQDSISERVFEIKRTIELTFSDADSDGKNIVGTNSLGWNSSDMGGIYRETITGLYKNTFTVDQQKVTKENIDIEGIFLLHKVSDVGTLTSQ